MPASKLEKAKPGKKSGKAEDLCRQACTSQQEKKQRKKAQIQGKRNNRDYLLNCLFLFPCCEFGEASVALCRVVADSVHRRHVPKDNSSQKSCLFCHLIFLQFCCVKREKKRKQKKNQSQETLRHLLPCFPPLSFSPSPSPYRVPNNTVESCQAQRAE